MISETWMKFRTGPTFDCFKSGTDIYGGTLGRQMDFGFGFLVIENRELSFYQGYPAISGYEVIFEKMTFDDL